MAAITASSYPLLDAFLTMLYFVGFFLWVWLAVYVFMDIFRSPDMSGLHKALWVILVLLVPFLGVLIYLLVRGHKMAEHRAEEYAQIDQANQEYIRSVVNTNGGDTTADQLTKLAQLRDSGALSQEEFDSQKARILASTH